MKSNKKQLTGTPDKDSKWILELSSYISIVDIKNLCYKDKKIIEKLFNNYKQEGFTSEAAMKKALLIYNCFNHF